MNFSFLEHLIQSGIIVIDIDSLLFYSSLSELNVDWLTVHETMTARARIARGDGKGLELLHICNRLSSIDRKR